MRQRLLLCCEQPIIADSFSALLGNEATIEIIGQTSGDLALTAAEEKCPDITLVVAPALMIVEHQEELSALARLSKVVVIVKTENIDRSLEALQLGVSAVLSLDTSSAQLIQALRMVTTGDVMVIPEGARDALNIPAAPTLNDGPSLSADLLTAREKEVILLLGQGASNNEIAGELSISITTVRTHVHNVLKKLGVGTRGQAVAVAYETGLITEIGGTAQR
ncbi:response regulator transcription factor [Actinomadura roseirufa]|uniref:response regulator transcription factor n=1 Tax=Actinomadura roseirufa TaxID=2094049 RepID=UPI0013F1483F|nr:response regulator transcription factor [Actinomadura roseirufa]